MVNRIYVQDLQGNKLPLDLTHDNLEYVVDLKRKIEAQTGVSASKFFLFHDAENLSEFTDREQKNMAKLSDYGIHDDCTLVMSNTLRGGVGISVICGRCFGAGCHICTMV